MNAFAGAFTDSIPEIRWMHGDDLCDCAFQRIGEWTNPYIGKTLRYRFCCIWEKFAEQYPEFVQEIPAYYDENADEMVAEPAEWNGEEPMPRDIWYRQIQSVTGAPLDRIRQQFRDLDPPEGR